MGFARYRFVFLALLLVAAVFALAELGRSGGPGGERGAPEFRPPALDRGRRATPKADAASARPPASSPRQKRASGAPHAGQNAPPANDFSAHGSLVEHHYPDARIVDRFRVESPVPGEWRRVTVLRADLKHPLVRVEDRFERSRPRAEPELARSVAMAAEHLVARPPEGRSAAWASARLSRAGFVVERVLPLSGRLIVSVPHVAGEDRLRRAEARLNATLEGRARAEPDLIYYPSGSADDPAFQNGAQWGLRNTGQNGGSPGADISAVAAWDIRSDASDVVVAVVDTGARLTHEDLEANLWTNPDEVPGNGVDDDGNGVVDDVHGFDAIAGSGRPADEDGHGTHVAGTIGARGDNATGVAGVAWRARLMPIRFLGPDGGFLSDAIEGLAYAREEGAAIVNNSWASGGFSSGLRDAIERLAGEDILFVAAAGNDGSDNDARPSYPASYTVDNVIAVASSDRDDRLSEFSNFGGTSVDLAAPGASIRSTFASGDASYASLSGTSMATPHVSGAAAVLRAEFPDAPFGEIKGRLLDNVDPAPAFAGETASGGRLNLDAALRDEAPPRPGALRFDAGSVNAAESSGKVALIVSREGGSDGAVSARLDVAGATATEGEDFAADADRRLEWADGDASERVVNIGLADDSKAEGVERFSARLESPEGGASIGAPAAVEVAILDDEERQLEGFGFDGARRVPSDALAFDPPAPALAAAPGGGFAVAETEAVDGRFRVLVRRFDASGGLRWERRHAPPGEAIQPRIAFAPDGRLVAGYSRLARNGDGEITDVRVAALAYDASGAVLWDRAMPRSSSGWDFVNAVAVGGDGAAYLAGGYSVDPAGLNPQDAFIARVERGGGFAWVEGLAFNPAFGGDDSIEDVAAGPGGDVFAGGWTGSSAGFAGIFARVNPDGSRAFVRRFDASEQQRALSVARNDFGETFLGLRAFDTAEGVFNAKVARVSPRDGAVLWQRAQAIRDSAPSFRIGATPNGQIVFAQGPRSLDDAASAYSVGRYTRDGEKRFENNLDAGAPITISALTARAGGGLAFAGAFSGKASLGEAILDGGGESEAYVARMAPADPPEPGRLAFEIGRYSAPEDAGRIELVVRRSDGVDGAVAATLETVAGSAAEGDDFIGFAGERVEFAPGQTAATVGLAPIEDFQPEDDETLAVRLTKPEGGAVLGDPREAGVTLLNDDFAYEAWLSENFDAGALGDPAISGERADPDGDGMPNLVEYAFGLDPSARDRPRAIRAERVSADRLRVRFERAVGRDDLRYQVEGSTDLGAWRDMAVVDADSSAIGADRERRELVLNDPFGAPAALFLRLRVERTSQRPADP